MRKILLSFIATMAMCVSFCGCSSNDDEETANALVGTVWECAKNSDLYTFEFNSGTTCKLTQNEKQLDSNFDWINVTSYIYYSYTIDGNKVTLNPNDDILVPLIGTINGNSMSIVNTSTGSVIYNCAKVK